ncbi:MAG: transporter substrate-binding domain-containing protein [Helicobacteraceae bacterium]|jgi:ABC-type amino acid transport substrate-binding protein|nr:transporter substrate-binding domain-containing protein [Helicobacteraceae bacterium]
MGSAPNKSLKIGADPFPPYQYYDNGVLRGSDYERVKSAGEKAGFDLEFFIDDWAAIERRFEQKTLDAVFQLPKTPEREQKYHFSKLLRTGATEVVAANGAIDIAGISDIQSKGYLLGVAEGVSYGAAVQALSDESKVVYSDNEKLLIAVAGQAVDFGIFDRGVKAFLAEKLSLSNIRAIEALTFNRELFIAFNDPAIRDAFDRYL